MQFLSLDYRQVVIDVRLAYVHFYVPVLTRACKCVWTCVAMRR